MIGFLAFWAMAAPAQTSFDVQLFRPSLHGTSMFTVESGAVPEGFELKVDLWGIYVNRPLELYGRSGQVTSLVSHRLDGALTAAFSMFGRLSIGVGVPVTFFQSGDLSRIFQERAALAPVAFGDIRIEPKVQLLKEAQQYLDLALLAALTVPSGFEGGFNGDRSVTAAGELDIGRSAGPLKLALNFGFLWRERTSLFDIQIGPELYGRFGANLDIARIAAKVPLEIIAELDGRTSVLRPFRAGESPMMFNAGLRFRPTSWMQISAGAGRGILPGYGSPVARAFLSIGFVPFASTPKAPASEPVSVPSSEPASAPVLVVRREVTPPPVLPQDADEDGLADAGDSCPNDPEDKDDYQDDDGCPEPDNDADGILDGDDKCPDAAEVINGVDDMDGCPDKGTSLVVVTKDAIEIKDKIYFKTKSDKIEKRSFGLLDQVASALKAHGEIRRIRIEGHTDDVGKDAVNLKLSQARADSVRAHLIANGKIEAKRLEAVGYGETKPIATNRTARGRESNRRVAFAIVEGADSLPEISKPAKKKKTDPAPEPALVAPKKPAEDPPLVAPKKKR